MKSLIKIFFAGSIITVMLASCAKKLEIKPRQSIDSETALTTPANIEAALASAYAGLKAQALYGRDIPMVSDALADIGRATNHSGRLNAENRNNFGAHLAFWGTSYGIINEINSILAALPKVQGAVPSDLIRWEGECRALRGLLYFDLVRTYAYIPTAVIPSQDKGGVVLKYSPTLAASDGLQWAPERAPINVCYDSVYSDLSKAASLLSNSRGIYYFTKTGTIALLSRVALYRGDWADVIAKVNEALAALPAGVGLTNTTDYVANWRAPFNKESLFEVRFATQQESLGVNVSLQTSINTLLIPGNNNVLGGWGDFVPNSATLTALGISAPSVNNITYGTDIRGRLMEWGAAGRATRNVECTKFIGKSGFPYLDNFPVIRVAELYLNRAEAYYKLGGAVNEALALADVNTIRTSRGLTPSTATGTALFTEIQNQRRLEFLFEGHRFFDMKRWGMDISKTQPATIFVPFSDIRILPAIPQGELDGNPKMVQNPGY